MLVSQRTGFLFNLSFQQERWFPKVVKFFEHLKCLHVDWIWCMQLVCPVMLLWEQSNKIEARDVFAFHMLVEWMMFAPTPKTHWLCVGFWMRRCELVGRSLKSSINTWIRLYCMKFFLINWSLNHVPASRATRVTRVTRVLSVDPWTQSQVAFVFFSFLCCFVFRVHFFSIPRVAPSLEDVACACRLGQPSKQRRRTWQKFPAKKQKVRGLWLSNAWVAMESTGRSMWIF